jgi:multiple sugar transport system substrate-binding protein
MKRTLSLLMSVMLVLTLFSGFGLTAASAESTENAPITIDFWNSWTGADGEVLEEIVDRFNEVNPYNITIEMDRDSDMNTKLQVAYASNTAPALTLINTGSTQDLVYQGAIIPIDDIFDKTTLSRSDFVESILTECSDNGVLYSIPMQVNTRFLYWNKTLLAQAGYDPDKGPETWEELKEMSAAISALGDNIYGGGCPYDFHAGLILMIKGYGGDIMQKVGDDYVCVLDSPETLEAVTLWKEMIDNGSAPALGGTDYGTMFQAGTLGFTMSGAFFSTGLSEYVDFGISVLPGGPNGRFSDSSVGAFAITKCATEEEIAACYKFLDYWENNTETAWEESQYRPCMRWALDCGFPPYLVSVRNDPLIASTEPIATMCSYADYVTKLFPEGFRMHQFIRSDCIQPMFEEIAFGADVQEAITKYAAKMDTWKDQMIQ